MRRGVQTNLAEFDRQLSLQKSCSRLQVEGGWYAVLRSPVTRSDEDLSIELVVKENVYVHPGHFYDFPSDGYLIVSLITPELADFAKGIELLLSMFLIRLFSSDSWRNRPGGSAVWGVSRWRSGPFVVRQFGGGGS